MKKNLLLILGCSLFVLAACSTGGTSSSVSGQVSTPESTPTQTSIDAFTPVEFDTTKEVTINFYSTMGSALVKNYDIFIEDFYELYPNIKVNHTQPGGYDDVRDQIKTELSVGQGPDVAYCYPDHVALYNKTKKVVRLDNLIADETYGIEDVSNFVEGYYEEGRSFGDGYMYTLPFSKSTEVLYYNKDFFAANNLTVPTTWDEMEAVCAKIKEIDPSCVPLGYDSESNWFITMTEQLNSEYTTASGKDHFLFNNDTNKSFVKKFKGWYDKGYVTTQEIYGAYTSGLFTQTAEGEQKCYMCIGSSAGASHQIPGKDQQGNYPFETGIAPIPQVDANNKKVISQGPSLCMFNQKDPQKIMASWLFVKWMTTYEDFQAQFSIASGYVPVIKSVQNNEFYKAHVEKAGTGNAYITATAAKLCVDMAQVPNYYFTSDAFIGSSDARDQVGLLMQNVFTFVPTATDPAAREAEIDAQINTAFESAVYQCNQAIGNV